MSSSPPTGPAAPDPADPAPSDDERRLAEIADRLLGAVVAAAEPWARAQLAIRLATGAARGGRPVDDPELVAAVEAAVATYRQEVTSSLAALLATDVDRQRSTPLSLLRAAAASLHPPLELAGVPEARRDELDRARDPEDRWALAPAGWADLGPEVSDAGITWGAAKAHVLLARRRGAGRPVPDVDGQDPGGSS